MYESFFGLLREPFSVAPDPRFLFLSAKHREALGHLQYGLRGGGGFVLLTGEIGAGKTTVWRTFLEALPGNFDVAYVVNPKLGVAALMARICEDLRVDLPGGVAATDSVDAIHGHLLLSHANGRRTLIVVDEAQALSVEVLEQLRLLTNLVTAERKLVQVLLIGQPELRDMLELPVLEPTAQRVVARYHLSALSEDETVGYIRHRLSVAGLQGELPFDSDALGRIHRLCGGVPRRINVLCDRALLGAHAQKLRRVDRATVERSAREVFGQSRPTAAHRAGRANSAWPLWLAGVGISGLALLAGIALAPWLASRWTAAQAVLAAAPAAVTVPVPAAPASLPTQAAVSALVPPAPPAPPSPTAPLDAVFATLLSDEPRAWRALGGMWGVVLAAGDPCSAALAQSLQCYRGRGGLAPIGQIDRPVVVTLTDERGRSVHAVMVSLAGDGATLRVGNVDHGVPLAALARVWRGEFATLWRAPPGYRDGEMVGASGPLAAWLAQKLAAVDGRAVPAAAGDALAAQVFAFQLAQGLTPDGLAGPLTLMKLNRASGIDEPRLLTGR